VPRGKVAFSARSAWSDDKGAKFRHEAAKICATGNTVCDGAAASEGSSASAFFSVLVVQVRPAWVAKRTLGFRDDRKFRQPEIWPP
jgi:hypothetical protein